jgi:signal transduction histidine kinase
LNLAREKCDGEEDAISVQDTDLGVSAGDRQRIFERFRGARFDLRLLTA